MTQNSQALFLGSLLFPIFASMPRFPIPSAGLISFFLFVIFISLPTLLLYLAAYISTYKWFINTCLVLAVLFSILLSISAGAFLISGLINLLCILISFIVLLVAAGVKFHRRLTHPSSGTPNGAPYVKR